MTKLWVRHKQVLLTSMHKSADCDLDLWSSDMVLVRNTLSCPDNQLFLNHSKILSCITKLWVGHKQVSLKSMHNLSADCDLDI